MANPQKENGFTPIANEILENVYSRKFTANQLMILLVLWRYTYGFQRKEHEFSLGFLSEATGIDRKAIKRALDNLIKENVVIITKQATFNEPRKLAFNKNYDGWKIEKRTEQPQVSSLSPGGKNDHTTVGEYDHSPGGSFDHQERNNKEILKKEEEEELPENSIVFYEENFGPMTPVQIQKIIHWIEDFENEKVVSLAVKETALRNPDYPFSWMERVLLDWHRRKLFTVADVLREKKRKEQKVIDLKKRRKQTSVDMAEVERMLADE